MAHELKTPLTSIQAATTGLLANPDQPIEVRLELTRIADEETERLRILIDDTIEMARLDTSTIDVQLERLDLAEVVRETVASIRNKIDSRSVVFVPDAGLTPIQIDRRLIKLALRQLLDNALKYSPPNKPIELRVRGDSDHQILDVTDHGPGIPVSEQAHVFDRFWRSPSAQMHMPGTGLGLSIARSIAAAHHGELTLHSTPDETTFSLRLPQSNAQGLS